jgi:CheY-like chemotaxis protein/tRNA A-37 threonylcarbamoyl transferase component Bud32
MDATSANLGMSRDEFIAALVASRLLADAEVHRLVAAHPDDDALGLAKALLVAGTITDYQLDALNQGRATELRVGNYDILDRLGAGGMGTVFKARHRRMKRVVALKVLSTALCKDEAFVQRFQREVETIARLGHPNVVMAYDADVAECGHFLVMEFVDGRDLISFVEKNNPLDVARAVDCIVQSARGLAYAHAQGIIHRDIKPGNLLRDASGVVKVTDLGLARLNTPDAESATGGLTQAGGVLGTVDYMAPEQAVDSTAVDHRADIYSLGATLHFLLTGHPPYTGKSAMSVLLKHRDAPIPDLRAARPDVTPELAAVFNRMMAKRPEDRFASMHEVAAALEKVTTGSGPVPDPVSAPVAPSGSSVVMVRADAPTDTGSARVTVVLVEPSRVQAGITRRYLEAQDVTVSAAVTTGEAAAAAVKEHHPDVVVSALYLADTTGVELAKKIRAEVTERRTGFVLISSESDGADPAALSKLDHVVLLPKPFTPERLVQALNVVTGKSVIVKSTAVSVTGLEGLHRPGGTLAGKPRARAALRILIVDDSATARMIERKVLQELGFANFAEAADGAQAIAAATREPFDLIVTDFNMPLMDGRALISYLKQTPTTAEIPIVMVTTETSPALLDPIRAHGVTVLAKTFDKAVVQPVVDKLFG